MYDTPLTNEQIIAALSAAPARLAELTAGLSPEQLLAPPAAGEWSARDVLAHLRACADVWGGYIAKILREERPAIRAVSPRTWIKQTVYLRQDFAPSLAAFSAQRSGLLALLRSLAPQDWQRLAVVTAVGKTQERSLYTYAQWIANHERSHLRQVEEIVAALQA